MSCAPRVSMDIFDHLNNEWDLDENLKPVRVSFKILQATGIGHDSEGFEGLNEQTVLFDSSILCKFSSVLKHAVSVGAPS